MADDRVAMFIDFENLVFGVENNEQLREREPDIVVDVERLVRFARDEGQLVLARAYADWRGPATRHHQGDLYVQGIETVEVMGRRFGGELKNSVDVALAVDAVGSLYERSYDTFILVSGDRDFLPLLRAVREHGHRIIGVSVRESASRDLPNLCDRFVFYRDLWRTYGPEQRRPGAAEIRDLSVFAERLRALLAEEVGRGGILGAQLKPMIRNRIDPGFDETQLGFVKFSKLLEALPTVVRIEYSSDAHDIRVFAVEEGQGGGVTKLEPEGREPQAASPQPSTTLQLSPELFESRAQARLARTGLHLDRARRSAMLEAIYAELPTNDAYRSQLEIIEALVGQGGLELDAGVLRRYLWALYQSWVFDIRASDRQLDHKLRGLRLKPEYATLDMLTLRLEQSLIYKIYDLLPPASEDAAARVMELLELESEGGEGRARELLERVEAYRASQQQRGR